MKFATRTAESIRRIIARLRSIVSVLLDEHAGILNRYLFRQACRIDLNAWIKLKYRRRIDEISDEDLSYYKPTVAEAVARWLRRGWRILTGRQWRNARRQGRSE